MEQDEMYIRVSHYTMKSEFLRILNKTGYDDTGAEKIADIFLINSLEGVYSHGVNRFVRFIRNTEQGFVRTDVMPVLIHKAGGLEQWNGNLGPGPLNASFAVDRAMELASGNAIGMVAMANTNHWLRAGTYGWQAARKGFLLICWTNTCRNMPAWGARDARLGNNPLAIGVPFRDEAIVLDFAMSQYSYGKMDLYRSQGRQLPFPGGFDSEGNLTTDPGAILESYRPLPVGYWKGSGLSLLLDITAAVLSGGRSTTEIKDCAAEHGLSQVFIAIDLKSLYNYPAIELTVRSIIEEVKGSVPIDGSSCVRYPGENVAAVRNENLREGIPVEKSLWEKITLL